MEKPMTPEERERTMDFILHQQVQFQVGMENLQNDLRSLSGTVQTLAGATLNLMNIVQQDHELIVELDRLIKIHSRRLDDLEGNSPS